MKKALYFLLTIFAVSLINIYYQWYLNYSWFDQVLHFSGGLFIAMFFSAYLKEHLFGNSKLKNTLIILGVTSFIGVTWEFAEYIANQILIEPFYRYFQIHVYFMGDLNDTVNDLLMDILGAGVFSIVLHSLRSREAHQVKTNL